MEVSRRISVAIFWGGVGVWEVMVKGLEWDVM